MVERDEGKSYKSVDDLMNNPHYWASSEIGPKAFGNIFKGLREREGYSQRDLAEHLRVDEAAISRMEKGERNPPRRNSFYDRLQTIPGWNEDDVAFLMGTSAHRLLFPDKKPKMKLANIQDVVELGGIRVRISLTADRNIVPKDEHHALMDISKPMAHLRLLDITKHIRTEKTQKE